VTVGSLVTFQVPTSSGTVDVNVPAGPQPGGYCNVVGTYVIGAY
jgi:hypothetical protein